MAVHFYSQKTDVVDYKVTVMKVNPFKQIYSIRGQLTRAREIQRLPRFPGRQRR